VSHRCINAFEYANRIYPGGCEVADDDPILSSHREHFAKVDPVPSFVATETASATPGEKRAVEPEPKKAPPPKAPAKKAAPKIPEPEGKTDA
jgi:hypothetical protein